MATADADEYSCFLDVGLLKYLGKVLPPSLLQDFPELKKEKGVLLKCQSSSFQITAN